MGGWILPSTLTRHDLHIRLTEHQYRSLRAFADTAGLGLNAGMRLLVERGTAPAGTGDDGGLERLAEHVRSLQAVVVAGLLASEHAVKLLEILSPDGRVRARQIALDAADDARRRLDQVEHWIEEAHRP